MLVLTNRLLCKDSEIMLRLQLKIFLTISLAYLATADICTEHTGIDYVCCDLTHQTVSDPGACCDLCKSSSDCTFWKFDTNDPNKYCYLKSGIPSNPTDCSSCIVGFQDPPPPPPPPAPKHEVFSCPSSTLIVYNDTSYDASSPFTSSWFQDGDIIVMLEKKFYSSSSKTLATTQMGPEVGGNDNLGSYTSFPVTLTAVNGTADGAIVNVKFICYSSGLVVFNLTLPLNDSGSDQGPANGNLLTHFPSFNSSGVLGEEVGWLLNGGIWTLFEFFGVGTNHGYQGSDGPAWFYNTSFYPSTVTSLNTTTTKTDTVLISALDHFKSMLVGVYADPFYNIKRLSWGLQGSSVIVPGGFTTSFGLLSGKGITETTYEWGKLMTSAYQTKRLPLSRDVLNAKLSYWSDNVCNFLFCVKVT